MHTDDDGTVQIRMRMLDMERAEEIARIEVSLALEDSGNPVIPALVRTLFEKASPTPPAVTEAVSSIPEVDDEVTEARPIGSRVPFFAVLGAWVAGTIALGTYLLVASQASSSAPPLEVLVLGYASWGELAVATLIVALLTDWRDPAESEVSAASSPVGIAPWLDRDLVGGAFAMRF
jgi:hypothetical protein